MMIAVFRANRGDEHDDEGVMTKEEKQNSRSWISHKALLNILQKKCRRPAAMGKYTGRRKSAVAAIRSETCAEKYIGYRHLLFDRWPDRFPPLSCPGEFLYSFQSEPQYQSHQPAPVAYLKSRITGQRTIRMAMRYLLTGGLVILASYLIAVAI